MKKLCERDIEKYLVKRVKELGGEVRKVQWIGRRGAPDRLVMLPWRTASPALCEKLGVPESTQRAATTVWVELKAPGIAPEPHQKREHIKMRALGLQVSVVDSLQRVDEVLA